MHEFQPANLELSPTEPMRTLGHARKLNNPEFMSKAAPAVIDKTRRIHQELQEKLDRLARTVESLT